MAWVPLSHLRALFIFGTHTEWVRISFHQQAWRTHQWTTANERGRRRRGRSQRKSGLRGAISATRSSVWGWCTVRSPEDLVQAPLLPWSNCRGRLNRYTKVPCSHPSIFDVFEKATPMAHPAKVSATLRLSHWSLSLKMLVVLVARAEGYDYTQVQIRL